jgi:alpha-glucosidase
MSDPLLLHHQVPPFLIEQGERIRVQLWLRAPQDPTGVYLRLEPDNEERLVPMARSADSGPWRVYEAALIPNPADPLTVYAFKVLWSDHQRWLDAAGQSSHLPLRERFFRWRFGESTPDWVPDQVFYQIFPERFRASGESPPHPRLGQEIRRGEGPIRTRPWGEAIDPRHPNTELYGGDLIGVRQALDYLEDLGVSALYLNPVFTSPSVHKYDTEDFEHVDPRLGGDQSLVDLRSETRRRGMRYLLDAVFNHTSDTHPWFNRWGTHPQDGAYQGEHAPYRSAYSFSDPKDPESYFCWQGSKVLPVLDFANPLVQDYFIRAPDAIVRRWLRPPYAADGWRIDVAHMMGEGTGARNNARVLADLRQAVKEESPDAYLVGEHFSEATRWLQGDLEDGAMNYYGFAHPVRAFLAGQDIKYHPIHIEAAELDAWLTDARSRIPYANQLCQLNLLGSHDTARFLTLVKGDRELMGLALLLLFTYPGVPCVYYGDEIGMTGANDPFNRACFDWEPAHWDQELRTLVQRLAGLRRGHDTLRRGGYQTLLAGGDCFAFARFDERELMILAVNRGERSVQGLRIDLGVLPWSPPALESLHGAAGWTLGADRLLLDLPAKGGTALLAVRGPHGGAG